MASNRYGQLVRFLKYNRSQEMTAG